MLQISLLANLLIESLSQSDFYQMAAYGQKYLGGTGEMFLIYPRSPKFSSPLPSFELSPNLRLWVVPFDLETDDIRLPEDHRVGFAIQDKLQSLNS